LDYHLIERGILRHTIHFELSVRASACNQAITRTNHGDIPSAQVDFSPGGSPWQSRLAIVRMLVPELLASTRERPWL
jgi:hypothetical protein